MLTLLARKKPADRWELIKAALRIRGSSLTAVARAVGVTSGAAYHVKSRPYPAVQAEIARVLDVPATALWPERYDACGAPRRQRPNAPLTKPQIRGSRAGSCAPKSSRQGGVSNAEEVA